MRHQRILIGTAAALVKLGVLLGLALLLPGRPPWLATAALVTAVTIAVFITAMGAWFWWSRRH